MKSFLVLLVVLCAVAIRSQSIHSLDGIENQQGQTVLLYRLGSGFFPYNPVYKFNSSDLSEELIIDAYYINYPSGVLAKAVWDFEYFPDKTNFMNVGEEINPDNHSFIARNDSIVFGGIGGYYRVDISKQDPMKVFAFGGGPITRSFDGGFTFPLDSMGLITDFDAISLADFDDSVLFGINSENQFAKNSVLVDTAKVFFDQFAKVLYDVNQFHIYRANKTYAGYSLNVSNNKGNAYTWTKTYQSENPLFITIDSSNSGLVYLADGRRIYKSTNNGYSFILYRQLSSKIVGVYKKPGNDDLFAATSNAIYKVTTDSILVIKSLPISPEEFAWFPLAVGNKWVFASNHIIDNQGYPPTIQFAGTKYMDVVKDTVIGAQKYFVLENNILNQFIYEPRMFIRIDSTTGFIYRYWESLGNESVFHNLNAEIGDTIYSPVFPYMPFYSLTNEDTITFLGQNTYYRDYTEHLPCGCGHSIVKGFGLAYTMFFEFGGSSDLLKGAIINGIVYGDTSFVVSVKNEIEKIPKEFALYQNYPNPFNPSTMISWQSPVGSWQTLKVFDVLGREVATLVDEYRSAGSYEIVFDAKNLSSGVYYYHLVIHSDQLRTENFIQTKKMQVIK